MAVSSPDAAQQRAPPTAANAAASPLASFFFAPRLRRNTHCSLKTKPRKSSEPQFLSLERVTIRKQRSLVDLALALALASRELWVQRRGNLKKTKGCDFSCPLAALIHDMVSNTCIMFIIFSQNKTTQPLFFFSSFFRFVFILNKPPCLFGSMSLPVPAPVVAFRLAGRNGGEVMCHLSIFGPSLPACFPPAQLLVFLCFVLLFDCASKRANAPNATEHKQTNPVNSHLHFRTPPPPTHPPPALPSTRSLFPSPTAAKSNCSETKHFPPGSRVPLLPAFQSYRR